MSNHALDPTHPTLEFGISLDDRAEIVATHDMLGFNLFSYNEKEKRYAIRPKGLAWGIPISDCRNINLTRHFPWPGDYDIRYYLEKGFDNLGYISTVCDHPELAEYLDNPGILVLLMEDLTAARKLLAKKPGRLSLVRTLSGKQDLSHSHIRMLKKVRPLKEHPSVIAATIRESILRVPALSHSGNRGFNYLSLSKLFAHQSKWTPKGLELARMLASRPELFSSTLSWLLHSCNGDEARIIAIARDALLKLANNDEVPHLVAERARYLANSRDSLTPEFSRRLRRTVGRAEDESGLLDICALLLNDNDVPTPVVPGDQIVKPLDTLKKIRAHAITAKNCVWSLDIMNEVLSREVDLYSVQGKNLYTISIDRRTLEIIEIEAAEPSMIDPRDLGLISDWFDRATRLPR